LVGGTVNITVDATDNVAVTQVLIKIDYGTVAWLNSPPYFYSWDTSSYAAGTHIISASATDSSGIMASSETVNVAIFSGVDTIPPNVSIHIPGDGAVLFGVTSIWVVSTDNVGVSNILYYANGQLIGAVNAILYGFYILTWDTTTVAVGSYTLTVQSFDYSNNSAISAPVNFTVIDVIPPYLSGYPNSSSTSTSTSSSASSASSASSSASSSATATTGTGTLGSCLGNGTNGGCPTNSHCLVAVGTCVCNSGYDVQYGSCTMAQGGVGDAKINQPGIALLLVALFSILAILLG